MLQVYNAQPNLTIINGEIKTTSLAVSKHFGKRHDHVLRDIENLECSDGFRLTNFGESSYLAGNGKQEKCYDMTKDGFMFLAMGFTGKKAADIKESYINSFNAMAKELINIHATYENRIAKLEQSLIAPPQIKTKPVNINGIDPADILKIDAIMEQHGRCGIYESGIYSLAKRNFVNKVVAKKIIRMFIEDGEKFQAISHYDEYNRNLKFQYFLKDVEIK